MGILQNFLDKWRAKKEKANELEEDYSIQKKLIERHKNANERELERYQEEDRQEAIQNALRRYRQRASNELWSGAPVLKGNKKLYSDNSLMRGRNFNKMRSCFLR